MAEKEPQPKLADKELPEHLDNPYLKNPDAIEAHILADMLRIEQITTELREFKNGTNANFADLKESIKELRAWIIAIVGFAGTTLVTVLIAMILGSI